LIEPETQLTGRSVLLESKSPSEVGQRNVAKDGIEALKQTMGMGVSLPASARSCLLEGRHPSEAGFGDDTIRQFLASQPAHRRASSDSLPVSTRSHESEETRLGHFSQAIAKESTDALRQMMNVDTRDSGSVRSDPAHSHHPSEIGERDVAKSSVDALRGPCFHYIGDSLPVSPRSHDSEAYMGHGSQAVAKENTDALRQMLNVDTRDLESVRSVAPSHHPSESGEIDVAKSGVDALRGVALQASPTQASSPMHEFSRQSSKTSQDARMIIAKDGIESLKQSLEGAYPSSTIQTDPSFAQAQAWSAAAARALDEMQNSARSSRSASSVRSSARSHDAVTEAMNALERIRSREQALGLSSASEPSPLAQLGDQPRHATCSRSRTDSYASLHDHSQVAAARSAEDSVVRIKNALFGQQG
jgi:hypothetical protein